MRTLHSFVIVALIALLLSACMHEVKPEDIASADYGKVPPYYKETIEGKMQGILLDPFSAMYRYFGDPIRGYAHVHGGMNPPEFGHLVQVGINAKNRMGAYTGEKLYVFLFKNETFWIINNPTHPYVVNVGPARKEDLPGGGIVLGVKAVPVDSMPVLAQLQKLNELRGLSVVQVTPGSIAASLGIQIGDIILRFGEKQTNTMVDLQSALFGTRAGMTVPITIWRQGKEIVLSASF